MVEVFDATFGWLAEPVDAQSVGIIVLAFVLGIMIMSIRRRR